MITLSQHCRAHLRASHADGAQQADLARALEHREQERDDDADDGDEDRQREEPVDQPEDLVDLGGLCVDERLSRLQGPDAELGGDGADGCLECLVGDAWCLHDVDVVVEQRGGGAGEEVAVHDVVAEGPFAVEDPFDFCVHDVTVEKRDGKHRPDRERPVRRHRL